MVNDELIKKLSHEIDSKILVFLNKHCKTEEESKTSYVVSLIVSSCLTSMFFLMKTICEQSGSENNMKIFHSFRDDLMRSISNNNFVRNLSD